MGFVPKSSVSSDLADGRFIVFANDSGSPKWSPGRRLTLFRQTANKSPALTHGVPDINLLFTLASCFGCHTPDGKFGAQLLPE